MNPYLSVLVGEIKNRASIYVHIYQELSKEVGSEKATEILKKAVYARGKEKGALLADRIKKPDLHELAVAFVEGKGEMDAFGHEVVSENHGQVILRLNRCPLVAAWKEAGLSTEERKKMCDIAHQVDFGNFETAGYTLSFNCRISEDHESCDMRLEIQPEAISTDAMPQ
jgi:predicted ArsR family transcriptional regulator